MVLLNGVARLYNAGTLAAFEQERDSLRAGFERLEAELSARRNGPFFQGNRFTLVDAVFGPIFRYFDVFEARAGLRLLDNLPWIGAWRVALAERPSVRGAVDDDYPELLAAFLGNRKAYISDLVAGGGAGGPDTEPVDAMPGFSLSHGPPPGPILRLS